MGRFPLTPRGISVEVRVAHSRIDRALVIFSFEEIKDQAGGLPKQVVVKGGRRIREAVLAEAELSVALIGLMAEAGSKAIPGGDREFVSNTMESRSRKPTGGKKIVLF